MNTLTTAPTLPPGTVIQVRVPLPCACGRTAGYAIFEGAELVAVEWLSHHGGEKHRTILTLRDICARVIVTGRTS